MQSELVDNRASALLLASSILWYNLHAGIPFTESALDKATPVPLATDLAAYHEAAFVVHLRFQGADLSSAAR
jgi:hypothetical protein